MRSAKFWSPPIVPEVVGRNLKKDGERGEKDKKRKKKTTVTEGRLASGLQKSSRRERRAILDQVIPVFDLLKGGGEENQAQEGSKKQRGAEAGSGGGRCASGRPV